MIINLNQRRVKEFHFINFKFLYTSLRENYLIILYPSLKNLDNNPSILFFNLKISKCIYIFCSIRYQKISQSHCIFFIITNQIFFYFNKSNHHCFLIIS